MQVTIDRVWKHYGVHNVSVSLDPGECLAVVGINGAGKSTLMRCLAGLLTAERGRILYDGEVLTRRRLDLREQLLLIPDSPPVNANQVVIDYLRDVLKAYKRWQPGVKSKVLHYLNQFQLVEFLYHPFLELSRGQVYKVALTALLVIRPELWLLDEPFASGMDAMGMEVLHREVCLACEQQSTVIFTTQILEIAQKVASRIAILHQGRLEAVGTMEQLREESHCSGSLLEIIRALTTPV